MMKMNNSNLKRKSGILNDLLNEISPVQNMQVTTKMKLSARIADLIEANGLGKGEFAKMANKNSSEVSKWLSGTQNFTIDTLSEIAVALGVTVADLFVSKNVQVVNEFKIVVSIPNIQPALNYITPLDFNSKGLDKLSNKNHFSYSPNIPFYEILS